ncbi:hypothetical protein C5F47_08730 [Nitrosopumilus cobalaminigenes]|uniref:Uncharacterized protein n=1 Tax=Nitrosopumilus cobalaminigenes TaxID=1470066 RepID=A0A7D5M1V5_9ARCH|nr:hypothetical protein [Nitrosopumilus cobalaminigenes]QLH03875.1 hypothetical protein C5F47_08730 [Nitrosopumilus cobalaminigenes]
MKVKSDTKLAIFDTFKTKGNDLTGEANRQRSIITILGSNANPAERTRTGISQRIAKKHDIAWKNIYSGIFRDLDEILLPMGIAEEDGRLPLKRGPKALQEKGIPYYHLTKKGILVALSITEVKNKEDLMKEFFSLADSDEKEFEEILSSLIRSSPNFTHSIFQKYVKQFCEDKISKLLPFDLSKLSESSDESLIIQKEILDAFLKFSKQEKDEALKFLNRIIPDEQ